MTVFFFFTGGSFSPPPVAAPPFPSSASGEWCRFLAGKLEGQRCSGGGTGPSSSLENDRPPVRVGICSAAVAAAAAEACPPARPPARDRFLGGLPNAGRLGAGSSGSSLESGRGGGGGVTGRYTALRCVVRNTSEGCDGHGSMSLQAAVHCTICDTGCQTDTDMAKKEQAVTPSVVIGTHTTKETIAHF